MYDIAVSPCSWGIGMVRKPGPPECHMKAAWLGVAPYSAELPWMLPAVYGTFALVSTTLMMSADNAGTLDMKSPRIMPPTPFQPLMLVSSWFSYSMARKRKPLMV